MGMDPPDIMTELGYLDEVRMEALVASQIGAVAQHVLVVGGEREYLACLLCLATLPDAENLDAPALDFAKRCGSSASTVDEARRCCFFRAGLLQAFSECNKRVYVSNKRLGIVKKPKQLRRFTIVNMPFRQRCAGDIDSVIPFLLSDRSLLLDIFAESVESMYDAVQTSWRNEKAERGGTPESEKAERGATPESMISQAETQQGEMHGKMSEGHSLSSTSCTDHSERGHATPLPTTALGAFPPSLDLTPSVTPGKAAWRKNARAKALFREIKSPIGGALQCFTYSLKSLAPCFRPILPETLDEEDMHPRDLDYGCTSAQKDAAPGNRLSQSTRSSPTISGAMRQADSHECSADTVLGPLLHRPQNVALVSAATGGKEGGGGTSGSSKCLGGGVLLGRSAGVQEDGQGLSSLQKALIISSQHPPPPCFSSSNQPHSVQQTQRNRPSFHSAQHWEVCSTHSSQLSYGSEQSCSLASGTASAPPIQQPCPKPSQPLWQAQQWEVNALHPQAIPTQMYDMYHSHMQTGMKPLPPLPPSAAASSPPPLSYAASDANPALVPQPTSYPAPFEAPASSRAGFGAQHGESEGGVCKGNQRPICSVPSPPPEQYLAGFPRMQSQIQVPTGPWNESNRTWTEEPITKQNAIALRLDCEQASRARTRGQSEAGNATDYFVKTQEDQAHQTQTFTSGARPSFAGACQCRLDAQAGQEAGRSRYRPPSYAPSDSSAWTSEWVGSDWVGSDWPSQAFGPLQQGHKEGGAVVTNRLQQDSQGHKEDVVAKPLHSGHKEGTNVMSNLTQTVCRQQAAADAIRACIASSLELDPAAMEL